MDVAITGQSGIIGTALTTRLEAGGHRVRPMVRRVAREGQVAWDPAGHVDKQGLAGVDAVVHLAGEPIAQRWTTAAKKRILESRRKGTRTLATAIAAMDAPPRVLLSMSAEGYYGRAHDGPDGAFTESDGPGDDFLATVCQEWEAAADPARAAGIRVVHPRLGIALSRRGGAVKPMLLPASLGLGGPIGKGTQPWSWITLDDVADAFHHLLEHDVRGPINVAAGTTPQRDFAKALGRVLHRPAVMPLPAFAVKGLFGEMGATVLLGGHRLDTGRLTRSGFSATHRSLEEALHAALRRPRTP